VLRGTREPVGSGDGRRLAGAFLTFDVFGTRPLWSFEAALCRSRQTTRKRSGAPLEAP